MLAACDSLDGVTDGVLEDPRRCHFDPQVLACQGADSPACLTPPQVAAARKIYGPSVNPRTNRPLYPGLERGSELGWATWAGPQPLAISLDYFRYVVFEDPKWDFRTLDFDRDVARAETLDAARINALDPDLQPFFARGGKLIQYHGWNDPQIAPGNSVDYYNSVLDRLGGAAKVQGSYRLFMVPGMAHCGGGDGASTFDMVTALDSGSRKSAHPNASPLPASATARRTAPVPCALTRRRPSIRAREVPMTSRASCAVRRAQRLSARPPRVNWRSSRPCPGRSTMRPRPLPAQSSGHLLSGKAARRR